MIHHPEVICITKTPTPGSCTLISARHDGTPETGGELLWSERRYRSLHPGPAADWETTLRNMSNTIRLSTWTSLYSAHRRLQCQDAAVHPGVRGTSVVGGISTNGESTYRGGKETVATFQRSRPQRSAAPNQNNKVKTASWEVKATCQGSLM